MEQLVITDTVRYFTAGLYGFLLVLMILFKKKIIFKELFRKCEVWQAEIKVEALRKRKEFGARVKVAKMEALRELKSLYDDGIITQAEYEEKRKKLVDEI